MTGVFDHRHNESTPVQTKGHALEGRQRPTPQGRARPAQEKAALVAAFHAHRQQA